MPNWGYALEQLPSERAVKASGRDLRISPKAAREICGSIRKMSIDAATTFLEAVIALKKPVPYKRHKKEVPHRRGLEGWYAGRYPVKASRSILKILQNLRAIAEEKGLNIERTRIIHAAAHRGRRIRKIIPRAFGRSSPYDQQLIHVELAAAEI